MLDVVTVVDDGGDARRALEGVSLAVFSQFLKACQKPPYLRCFLSLLAKTRVGGWGWLSWGGVGPEIYSNRERKVFSPVVEAI